MAKRVAFLLGGAALLLLSGCTVLREPLREGRAPAQMVVVTTADWSATEALLQRYARQGEDAAWAPQGKPFPAVVGRKGLAWGRGLHGAGPAAGPQKREGDGKAPAGRFGLGTAFGEAAPEVLPWMRLPYRQMGPYDRCVDDDRSSHYNALLDVRQVARDWQSDEAMLRADGLYRLGLVIDHNRDPVVSEGGSCIFIHIWRGPGQGTAGCTALAADDLETLLGWLRPEAHPILVQLPREAYERLRVSWGLP